MCKRHRMQRAEATGPYEGNTRQLGGEDEQRRCAYRAFPWWTLWLIWPLVGLAKGAWTTWGTAWQGFQWQSIPLEIPLALVLIGIGVALLWRQRDTGERSE